VIKKLKKYWFLITVVLAITFFAWQFWNIRALAQSHDEIIKGQYKISLENQTLISNIDSRLKMLVEMGMLDKAYIDTLQALPKDFMDDYGNINRRFYRIGSDAIYVVTIIDSAAVVIEQIPFRMVGK